MIRGAVRMQVYLILILAQACDKETGHFFALGQKFQNAQSLDGAEVNL